MSNGNVEKNQIGAINILRFAAAISVLLYHYTFMFYNRGLSYLDFPILRAIFQYGYLGVPLFFMVSGFVVSLSAQGKDFISFLSSRVVRLYPMLWLASTCTFIFFTYLGGYHYLSHQVTLFVYVANLTMISSLFNIPLIDGSYWTLAVELKFYACIGLLILLGWFKHIKIITYLSTTALVFGVLLGVPYNSASYFLSGVVFYLLYTEGIDRYKAVCAATLLAVSIYYQYVLVLTQNSLGSIQNNVYIVLSFVTLFYITFLLIALRMWRTNNTAILTILGALTYPIYLLHQEIGAILFSYLHSSGYPKYLLLCVVVAFICVLAYILHICFEKKIQIKLRRLIQNVRKDILMNMAVVKNSHIKNDK